MSPDAPPFFHPGTPMSRVGNNANTGGVRDNFTLDFYVKNRIVEAMRTPDDKRTPDPSVVGLVDSNRSELQQSPRSFHNHSPHRQSPAHHHVKDVVVDGIGTPVSTAGEGASEDTASRNSISTAAATTGCSVTSIVSSLVHNTYHQQPITTFTTPPTYAYPFSALTVAGGAPSMPVSLVAPASGHATISSSVPTTSTAIGNAGGSSHNIGGTSSGGIKSSNNILLTSGGTSNSGINNGGGKDGTGGVLIDDRLVSVAIEPKPLLSAQYEALSDED